MKTISRGNESLFTPSKKDLLIKKAEETLNELKEELLPQYIEKLQETNTLLNLSFEEPIETWKARVSAEFVKKTVGLYLISVDFTEIFNDWRVKFHMPGMKNKAIQTDFIIYLRQLWEGIREGKVPPFRINHCKRHYVVRHEYVEKNLFHGNYVPLYVGMSKDLEKRLLDHINKPSSLGLYDMKKNFEKVKLKISYVECKELNEPPLSYLLEYFESKVREDMSPIVGNQ